MLEKLASVDRSLFLALNALHVPWMDTVMFWASKGLDGYHYILSFFILL